MSLTSAWTLHREYDNACPSTYEPPTRLPPRLQRPGRDTPGQAPTAALADYGRRHLATVTEKAPPHWQTFPATALISASC